MLEAKTPTLLQPESGTATRLDLPPAVCDSAGVFVRLGHLLLILALLVATDGHWAVLQTVAWTSMLANNLQTDSFEAAVTKTFDGEHPCAMCKVIKQGHSEERKQNQLKPKSGLKLEFPLPAENLFFIVPATADDLRSVAIFSSLFPTKPPTPPPRSSAV